MARGAKTGGRQKGSVNKLTADLKEIVLCSLHAVGGIEYLKKQAEKSPGPYMALLGKVLPLQLANDPNNPLIPPTPLSEADKSLISRYINAKETK